jgi:hypothetical protein
MQEEKDVNDPRTARGWKLKEKCTEAELIAMDRKLERHYHQGGTSKPG